MKVYFISGLAADSRVFKYIKVPENCEAVHLDWIKPMKNESLQSYALRLAEKIDGDESFAVIGLSMGGMMASEISQKFKPAVTILISSVPSSKHLPFYFKAAGKLNLHKAVPVSLVKSAAVIKRFFTAETDDDKIMIRQIIKDSDVNFIHWAMDAILKWKNEKVPSSYIHIHGTRDEVLPIRFTKPTHIIPKAGHLMVMTNASQVNQILKEALAAN
ncbi:MAG TPA: alpha/beta hydrolase [Puia sp.]|nr:alpha/beta hydrolase [Puia sp.]